MGNRIPLVYRYLLSYLVLLLIPILLIGLLFYQRFVGILQEEITLGHRHVLEQAKSTFEAKINEMNKIAIDLSSKPELSPDKLNKSMSGALDVMEALRYTSTNPFVHQVVYYLKDGAYFYSPNTTYPAALFSEVTYRFANWPAARFMDDLRGLNKPYLRPAEPLTGKELNGSRALTYLVPIPYNSPSPYGVLLFLIEEKSVGQLLEGALEERHGNSMIVDGEGHIIAALHHEPYMESAEFKRVVASTANAMTIADFNRVSYAVSTLKIGPPGWTYVTMLPANDFMSKANYVQTQFFVSVLIVLLIGSALIYLLMRLNYSPVGQLLAFMGKQWGDAVRTVQEARGTISRLAEDHRLLRTKLDNSRAAARSQYLLNLLRGTIAGHDSGSTEGADVGVVFTKPLYFVAMAEAAAESAGMDTSEQGGDRMEDLFRRYFESYRVDTTDKTRHTWICAISPEERQDWQRQLSALHRELSEGCGHKATLGVGTLYADISEVGKSYIEATTALDYKLIKGHNTLITFEEMKAENVSASWYPKEEMELLNLYLQQGDPDEVEGILQKLQTHMLQRPIPLHIARCICYDVMGCMIKAHYKLKGPQAEGAPYPDVFGLAKFETMQDLVALVRQMCLLVQETREAIGSDPSSADDWLAYIRACYREHDFSVQRMADHFAVSRSYLNASFKKLTGQTIMDFLDYYRLEKAKELLAGSSLQLKEVVQQIGYYDVSSFIRKFKQQLHITPGEFRRLHTAQEDAASV